MRRRRGSFFYPEWEFPLGIFTMYYINNWTENQNQPNLRRVGNFSFFFKTWANRHYTPFVLLGEWIQISVQEWNINNAPWFFLLLYKYDLHGLRYVMIVRRGKIGFSDR